MLIGRRKLIAYFLGILLSTVALFTHFISGKDFTNLLEFLTLFFIGGNSIEHIFQKKF